MLGFFSSNDVHTPAMRHRVGIGMNGLDGRSLAAGVQGLGKLVERLFVSRVEAKGHSHA